MRQIVLFYMEGCGHCIAMMPEWKRYVSQYNDKAKFCESGRIATLNAPWLNITSFPTIVVLDEGYKIKATYDGPRTAESFDTFAKRNSVV